MQHSPTSKTRIIIQTNPKTLPYGEIVDIFYAAPAARESPAPVTPVAPAQPSQTFLQAVETRRSHYSITNTSPVPDGRIVQVIQHAITHVPSSWNSQSSRALVLFADEHEWVWDTVVNALKAITSGSKFDAAAGKVNASMRAGHGTVLFFEDDDVVKGLQSSFPTYKDDFTAWSEQTSGMAQFITWVALEEEGLGANLQHYNKLIEAEVKTHFNVPSSWRLVAQMPFGEPTAEPGEKTFQSIEPRVKVYGL
ncbi:Nitroreductase [Calocera viscosa TUFC12733]|uniref:Nitroreductase n=1 Tax=Calocera viscosa (strain TUFC12733) TaxID=1330018 RepID=A0A167QBY7_CALVF|nr:Nitroreductase [Calocera viscosa TUFC12733]